MFNISRTAQNRTDGIIHHIKVRCRLLCPCLGFLQLNRGNQLHGLGDLFRALNTGASTLYISHGCHDGSPAF